MTKMFATLIPIAILLCFFLLTGKAVEQTRGDVTADWLRKNIDAGMAGKSGAADLRKIPLIIAREFLPDISDEGDYDTASERLDVVVELEPEGDVPAALIGAKLAGWAAGYEFIPVHCLRVGETPRDAIRKLPDGTDVVLLVRVSMRMFEDAIFAMADATLYRRPDSGVLLSVGFLGTGLLDGKQISGGRVDGEYWLEAAGKAFAREFDPQVLGKIQHVLQKQEIVDTYVKLQQSANPIALEPSILPLEGGEERSPELHIIAIDGNGVVYLEQERESNLRRWLLGPAQEVDVNIKPGVYTILIETWSSEGAGQRRVYRSEMEIDYKKRYSYRI